MISWLISFWKSLILNFGDSFGKHTTSTSPWFAMFPGCRRLLRKQPSLWKSMNYLMWYPLIRVNISFWESNDLSKKVQLILGDKDQLVAVQPIDASHLPSHQATSWTKWHLTPRKFGAKIKVATCSTGCCWWGIHKNPGWMGGLTVKTECLTVVEFADSGPKWWFSIVPARCNIEALGLFLG